MLGSGAYRYNSLPRCSGEQVGQDVDCVGAVPGGGSTMVAAHKVGLEPDDYAKRSGDLLLAISKEVPLVVSSQAMDTPRRSVTTVFLSPWHSLLMSGDSQSIAIAMRGAPMFMLSHFRRVLTLIFSIHVPVILCFKVSDRW